MPEVENKPKNWVKNRSPQGHFEGQDPFPLNAYTDKFDAYIKIKNQILQMNVKV